MPFDGGHPRASGFNTFSTDAEPVNRLLILGIKASSLSETHSISSEYSYGMSIVKNRERKNFYPKFVPILEFVSCLFPPFRMKPSFDSIDAQSETAHRIIASSLAISIMTTPFDDIGKNTSGDPSFAYFSSSDFRSLEQGILRQRSLQSICEDHHEIWFRTPPPFPCRFCFLLIEAQNLHLPRSVHL